MPKSKLTGFLACSGNGVDSICLRESVTSDSIVQHNPSASLEDVCFEPPMKMQKLSSADRKQDPSLLMLTSNPNGSEMMRESSPVIQAVINPMARAQSTTCGPTAIG